jgi:sec-independent protein translocase protein TatB
MFDIGFSEILVIAVVALLVVGPDEFPALVRTVGRWVGRVRRYVSELRAELDREVSHAEELKRMLAKEAEIADLHKVGDASGPTVAANRRGAEGGEAPPDVAPEAGPKQTGNEPPHERT